ncbi:MAG: hypothetical protein KC561_06095 [Myxococcales bacterium]|nr:hypothetical protein [Myxococcales bacterium]
MRRLISDSCVFTLLMALTVASSTAACGGQANTVEHDDPVEPGATTLVVPAVDVQPDQPLEEAFQAILNAFAVQNVSTLDARRAYATSAARDFAWYFTVNDSDDPAGRTNHVFFVTTAPWTEANTRNFLLSYLVMPASPATAAGRTWFHFYSGYEPPFAVRFMFSNTPLGALEATILAELGTGEWQPEQVPQITDRIVDLMVASGVVAREELARSCSPALDRVFTELPHPTAEEGDGPFRADYAPEGILASLGLLVGESLRAEVPGALSWEVDDLSDVYPRLRVSGVSEGVLRPIPFMIEFFSAETEILPTQYCERMAEALRAEAEVQ